MGCTNLTAVTLPATVKSIGKSAFADCKSLGAIDLPDGLTRINDHAFENCASLHHIVVPNLVKQLGSDTFMNCASLDSVVISGFIDKIESDVFRYCHSLRTVSLPISVKSIGDNAFEECTSLTDINLPISITKAKDVASPKLFAACCKGEQVSVELDFYRISPTGEEELYFKITLEDAIIVNIKEYTPLTFLPDNKPYHDMEDVSFTYSKITWSYVDGNVEFTDDWKA